MKTQNPKLVKDMTMKEVKNELAFMLSKRDVNKFDGGYTLCEYSRLISLHNRQLDLYEKDVISKINK